MTVRERTSDHPNGSHLERVDWMPILMYHRIVDEIGTSNPYELCISAKDFEAQMTYLSAKGYQTVTMHDAAQARLRGESPSEKQIVITFDDGYMDTYTKAFPVLQQHGFASTIYLVSSFIGKTSTWDAGKVPPSELFGMDEIREMQKAGIEFGSHSCSHKPMAELDTKAVQSQIVDSKNALEDILGSDVTTFAYPYGSSDTAHSKMISDAGYIAAVGIEERSNTPFNLSRVNAAHCSGTDLAWRMRVSGMHFRLRQFGALRKIKGTIRSIKG